MFEPSYPGPIDLQPRGRPPYLFVLVELSEVGREEAGDLLRRALRSVRTWMEGDEPELPPGEERRAARVVPELGATLPPLFRLVREAALDEEAFEAVGLACMHLATWAEKAGACRTALACLQTAEDADPDNPHYAYHIGRMARKLALYDAAEAWLKWTHWIARSRRNWEVAALALSGLGNLHRQLGNLPLATRFHELTRRVARRHNLRALEGDALYDLVGLSFDFGNPRQGMEYARLAIEAYGPGHSRIHTLARDGAWLMMDSFGEFELAAHVFEALIDHLWKPDDRLLLFASLARAAAGAGWKEVFERMWIETWALMRQQPVRDRHAAALVQLARGAGSLQCWDRAQAAAEEALRVAQERGEGEAVLVAESILDAIRPGLIAEEAMHAVFVDRSRPASELPDNEEVADLAATLTDALRAR